MSDEEQAIEDAIERATEFTSNRDYIPYVKRSGIDLGDFVEETVSGTAGIRY